MPNQIRVVLVDDHSLLRKGVALTLNSEAEFDVVGQGENADDACRLATELLPDVIILDISMPGGGINAAKSISTTCPVVKIAMLTVSEHDDDVLGSLESGARGYILKGINGPGLIEVVKGLHEGNSYVSPGLAARLLSAAKDGSKVAAPASPDLFSALTAREEQILEQLAKGLSNNEIGVELGITEKTVKHYVTNVLQKLQVRNRVEAALMSRDRVT